MNTRKTLSTEARPESAPAPPLWYVAHTRPRCEKKLAEYCAREGISTTLPLYKSVKKYPGKTKIFEKPLFPNYLFLRMAQPQAKTVYQSDHVANLLYVVDQELFEQQLGEILEALDTENEVILAPNIKTGSLVQVKSGPLRGMEGHVEERTGKFFLLLRLDFIGQAAAVKMDVSEVELV